MNYCKISTADRKAIKALNTKGPVEEAVSWRSLSPESKRKFKQAVGLWIYGALLAFIPTLIIFVLKPAENFTLITLFSEIEIIYVFVTMTILALSEMMRNDKLDSRFGLGLAVMSMLVIVGILIYGLLKGGVTIPILTQGCNQLIFNVSLFLGVLIMGGYSFLYIYIHEERKTK